MREGASPIELIDGSKLVTMLKEYGIGVKVESNEKVEIDNSYFESI